MDNKKLDRVSNSQFRIFSDEPIQRDPTKSILVTYEQINELALSIVNAMELDMNEDHRVMLQSEVKTRFQDWYNKESENHNYKDFLILGTMKVKPAVEVTDFDETVFTQVS